MNLVKRDESEEENEEGNVVQVGEEGEVLNQVEENIFIVLNVMVDHF